MAVPQSMLSVVARDEVHLQFSLKPDTDTRRLLHVLGRLWEADLTGIVDPTLNAHHQLTGGTANVVVGFRPELWRSIYPEDVPANLASFDQDLVGSNGMVAPAAQHDLWVWITQSSAATLYDSQNQAVALLAPYAELASEQVCFPYHGNVTFDGFVDGVANPNPFRAHEVAIISDGDIGAGGSTVLLQKWRMEVGRNQFVRDGEEIDIVRRNANYGNAREAGIMFVGFSRDISVTMGMLQQMYGVGPDGSSTTDRLLDFSSAVSSAIYFVPSVNALTKMKVVPRDSG